MLSILFTLDDKQYALDSTNVIEVTPLTSLKQVPAAPPCMCGLMNYRGKPLPVIDICMASHGRACRYHMNSRIIIMKVKSKEGSTHLVGLLVENVAGMARHDDQKLVPSTVHIKATPHFGQMYMDSSSDDMIQYINADALLTEEIQDVLPKDSAQQDGLQHVS